MAVLLAGTVAGPAQVDANEFGLETLVQWRTTVCGCYDESRVYGEAQGTGGCINNAASVLDLLVCARRRRRLLAPGSRAGLLAVAEFVIFAASAAGIA